MSSTDTTQSLLDSNVQWARKFARDNPGFLKESAAKQAPHALWIGCSDSRVPESVVLNTKPGVIFTHRNIANQFAAKDDNVHAVLDYAVEHLNVRHVYVVGHLGCGGVDAAYNAAKQHKVGKTESEPLERWIQPLVQLILAHKLHLKPKAEALPLIVLENIKAQVKNVCRTSTIIKAAASGNPVYVHGWVYNLEDGKIKDLNAMGN